MLDRPTILEAVLPSIMTIVPDPDEDPEAVGLVRIVATSGGVLAGVPVAKEIFGRLGVRTRALVDEGASIAPWRRAGRADVAATTLGHRDRRGPSRRG
jgi:nicotinate-nucleotide pyrophosphorylase